jgi:hypothetical protein
VLVGLALAAVPAAWLLATDTPESIVSAPPPAPGTAPATQRSADQKRQDDINRAMEFFRRTQPDMYEKAQALRTTDPAQFEKLIGSVMPTVNKFESIRRRNPKMFDLCMEDLRMCYRSLQIAHELKRSDLPAAERKQLTEQLREIVASDFDMQQKIRQMEIDDLRAKLSDLEAQVHAREDDKDALLRRRVEDLVERTPRAEW